MNSRGWRSSAILRELFKIAVGAVAKKKRAQFGDGQDVHPTVDVDIRCGELDAKTGFVINAVEPWIGYLAIEAGSCVGCCGFTSPPAAGVVEIAYFTYPDFERRGIATGMAQQLVSIAQECDPSVRIIAHTLTENASTHILKKLDFAPDLAGSATPTLASIRQTQTRCPNSLYTTDARRDEPPVGSPTA